MLELDELESMPSDLMGQLVLLQERLAQCDGALRICGLSPECEETLHDCQMDTALPNHPTRAEAVMGSGEYASVSRTCAESFAMCGTPTSLRRWAWQHRAHTPRRTRWKSQGRATFTSRREVFLADLAEGFEAGLGLVLASNRPPCG